MSEPAYSDEQWNELLSACVDDELGVDEAKELNDLLTRHPERAHQLDELRRLQGIAHHWRIAGAPPFVPPAAQTSAKTRNLGQRTRIWGAMAATFLLGILLGTFVAPGPGAPRSAMMTPSQVTPGITPSPANLDTPAERLLDEARAGELRAQLAEHLQQGDWQSALGIYEKIVSTYPATRVANELKVDGRMRRLAQRSQLL